MDYTEKEKIALKVEFSRMLANMSLDMAKNTLLTAFFETYVKLTEDEEAVYTEKIKTELTNREVERLLEITTSYHEKGELEGRLKVARQMLKDNLDIQVIVKYTGLTEKEVNKLKLEMNVG
ncbi:MAG: hypothetical protein AB1420_18525 [Bacillota bacterium]